MPVQIAEKDLRDALPDTTTPMRLPGLEHPVEVYRDAWGIPHIRAQCEVDLFFAQGFATAQDRLWHMDFDRHQALGRWAEFAGPAGVERDRLLRTAGMGRTALLDYRAASSAARAMVDAAAAPRRTEARSLGSKATRERPVAAAKTRSPSKSVWDGKIALARPA